MVAHAVAGVAGTAARQVADVTLESLSAAVVENAAQIERNVGTLNVMFVLISGYLVFLMQTGFAMLTAGSVRSKNTKNVLLKNVLDACVGLVAYYLFGYAFAYGPESNVFLGHSNWALSDDEQDFSFFFFQWTFAATAATIVSGSVAERTSFYAYLGYAFFLSGFVYPVVSHWVWSGAGWLGDLFTVGAKDFAGDAVVHMVGGFAGLAGAAIVGPRLGRFDQDGRVVPMPGHSATLCTLGTFILWFGWYGFNPGSTLGIANTGPDGDFTATAARCAVTTTIAAASAGVTTLVVIKLRDHIFDLLAILNGILAGLVAITASCAWVEPYAAVVIGIIGAVVYIVAAMILLKLKIDDPLEAFPIHGAVGVWGAFAVGLFARIELLTISGYGNDGGWEGVFYGGGGRLLAANCVLILAAAGWTLALIGPLFFVLNMVGVLRISPEMELIGNDVSKHGGVAYPDDVIMTEEKAAGRTIDNLGVDDSLRRDESAGAV
uniref:Ammonium transporter n=1 Tax=Bangia sp. ESS1 TaxID=2651159 RepID=A0A7S7YGP3_9RHOD|nr:ammonium transporter 1.1 [Bangia sp. ESS1]